MRMCKGKFGRTVTFIMCLVVSFTFMPWMENEGATAEAESSAEWITVDGIEGGQIRFDSSTGTIIDCEESVTKAIIPSEIEGVDVVSIGNDAFGYCKKLTNVIIPSGVINIGVRAFKDCINLNSISIPSTVSCIGDKAFAYCGNLADVNIPSNIESLGINTFYECGALCNINIPSSISIIPEGTFYGCGITDIVIPSNIKTIGKGAFGDCDNLTDISLNESLTCIEAYAFRWCDNLSNITIPKSVNTIGERAFEGCKKLSYINVSYENECYDSLDGVLVSKDKTEIIAYPCGGLTKYDIPSCITRIGDSSFSECYFLTDIYINSNVESIGNYAFERCYDLKNVAITDSISSIGSSAFWLCESLTTAPIPKNLKSIESCTFMGCESLNTVVIPDGVESIGGYAFFGCDSLESVTIPSSVNIINKEAFAACNSLKRVTFECDKDGCTLYDHIFYACTSLMNIIIPEGVKYIGYGMFSRCYNLESITIPDSVESVGEWAFTDCYKLKDVYYGGTRDQWNQISMYSYNDDYLHRATIHCIDDPTDYVEKSGYFDIKFQGSSELSSTLSVYYDDSLFSEESEVYNHKLAQFSLGMAVAGFTANLSDSEWDKFVPLNSKSGRQLVSARTKHISDLYSELGYTDVTQYHYEDSLNKTDDKVAFTLGRKVIKIDGDYHTLISVVLRGAGYGCEWSSNFNVGNSKYHQGWDAASDEVYSKLKDYVSTLENDGKLCGDVKINVTGYSRSAAVANILGGKIDDNYTDFTDSKSNIYVYTFATPRGVNKSLVSNCDGASYNNIFNIINTGDVVPRVVMKYCNYYRYGVNKYFSIAALNTTYKKVTDYRNSLIESQWTASKNAAQTLSVEKILSDIQIILPDFSEYYNGLQPAVMDLMANLNTKFNNGNKYSSLYKYCQKKYGIDAMENAKAKAEPYFDELEQWIDTLISDHFTAGLIPDDKVSIAKSMLPDLMTSMVYHGVDPNTAYQVIARIVFMVDYNYWDILPLALVCITPSYLNGKVDEITPDWMPKKTFDNLIMISEAHQPETYISWMFALGDTDDGVFGTASYTTTKINSKVMKAIAASEDSVKLAGSDLSISLYDESDNEVCRVVDGEIEKCDILDVTVDSDGNVDITTVDGEHTYRIEVNSISANDVNIMSTQKDVEGNEIERVVYGNIQLDEGDQLSGNINSESLTNENGGDTQTIEGMVISSEDATVYNVSTMSEGSGNVSESVTASYGDEITLIATPIMDAKFLGWYNYGTGEKISGEEELTLFVTSDSSLVAKFEYLPVTLYSSKCFHLIDGRLTGKIFSISGKDAEGTIKLSILDSGNKVLYTEEEQVDLIENNAEGISYNIDLSSYTGAVKVRAEFVGDSGVTAKFEKVIDKETAHNFSETTFEADGSQAACTYCVCEDCGFTKAISDGSSIGIVNASEDGLTAKVWTTDDCCVLVAGYDKNGRMLWSGYDVITAEESGEEIEFSCSDDVISEISKFKLFAVNKGTFMPLCQCKVV